MSERRDGEEASSIGVVWWIDDSQEIMKLSVTTVEWLTRSSGCLPPRQRASHGWHKGHMISICLPQQKSLVFDRKYLSSEFRIEKDTVLHRPNSY